MEQQQASPPQRHGLDGGILVGTRGNENVGDDGSSGGDPDPALAWQRRIHYTLPRRDPNLSAPPHDVDWWRAPTPRKGGLLHKLQRLLFKR